MPFFQQRGLAQARPGGRDVTVEGAFCMPGPDLRFFSLFRQLILFQVLLINSFSLKSRYIPSLFLGSLYKITNSTISIHAPEPGQSGSRDYALS